MYISHCLTTKWSDSRKAYFKCSTMRYAKEETYINSGISVAYFSEQYIVKKKKRSQNLNIWRNFQGDTLTNKIYTLDCISWYYHMRLLLKIVMLSKLNTVHWSFWADQIMLRIWLKAYKYFVTITFIEIVMSEVPKRFGQMMNFLRLLHLLL